MAWGMGGSRTIYRGTHYVVSCKRCQRHIPAAEGFPADNIVVACPLCGELRRYRPNEVYLGFSDSGLKKSPAKIVNTRLRQKRG